MEMVPLGKLPEKGDRVAVVDPGKRFPNVACFDAMLKKMYLPESWKWGNTVIRKQTGNVIASLPHPFRPQKQVVVLSLHSAQGVIAIDAAGVTRLVHRGMSCLVCVNTRDEALSFWHSTAFRPGPNEPSDPPPGILQNRGVPQKSLGTCIEARRHLYYPMEFVWLVRLEPTPQLPGGGLIACHAVEIRRCDAQQKNPQIGNS